MTFQKNRGLGFPKVPNRNWDYYGLYPTFLRFLSMTPPLTFRLLKCSIMNGLEPDPTHITVANRRHFIIIWQTDSQGWPGSMTGARAGLWTWLVRNVRVCTGMCGRFMINSLSRLPLIRIRLLICLVSRLQIQITDPPPPRPCYVFRSDTGMTWYS